MGRAKSRGSITFFFLVMLVLTAGVGTVLLRVLGEEVKSGEISRTARQQSLLFHSACKVLNGEPFLQKGETEQMPAVILAPGQPELILKRNGKGRRDAGYLCEEETLELWQNGYQPMEAVRLQMEMPGAEDGRAASGIWDGTLDGTKPKVDFGEFPRLNWSPFPDKERLKAPLAGQLFYESYKKAVKWNGRQQIRGRGILVIPHHLTIGAGCHMEGDFRIFSAGTVTVEGDTVLDKVYIYAAQNINISKNSHLAGILAAKGRVQLEEGAEFVPDASVLEPFRTPFIF